MTKDAALDKYAAARKLRWLVPLEQWREVFPTPESILTFWREVKGLCWPENYGQSPWDDASDVGYYLERGMSATTVDFYLERISAGDRFAIHKMKICTAYGCEIPDAITRLLP